MYSRGEQTWFSDQKVFPLWDGVCLSFWRWCLDAEAPVSLNHIEAQLALRTLIFGLLLYLWCDIEASLPNTQWTPHTALPPILNRLYSAGLCCFAPSKKLEKLGDFLVRAFVLLFCSLVEYWESFRAPFCSVRALYVWSRMGCSLW